MCLLAPLFSDIGLLQRACEPARFSHARASPHARQQASERARQASRASELCERAERASRANTPTRHTNQPVSQSASQPLLAVFKGRGLASSAWHIEFKGGGVLCACRRPQIYLILNKFNEAAPTDVSICSTWATTNGRAEVELHCTRQGTTPKAFGQQSTRVLENFHARMCCPCATWPAFCTDRMAYMGDILAI